MNRYREIVLVDYGSTLTRGGCSNDELLCKLHSGSTARHENKPEMSGSSSAASTTSRNVTGRKSAPNQPTNPAGVDEHPTCRQFVCFFRKLGPNERRFRTRSASASTGAAPAVSYNGQDNNVAQPPRRARGVAPLSSSPGTASRHARPSSHRSSRHSSSTPPLCSTPVTRNSGRTSPRRRSNNQTSPAGAGTAQHVSLQLFKAFPLTVVCWGKGKQTIITHPSSAHPHSEIHHNTTNTQKMTTNSFGGALPRFDYPTIQPVVARASRFQGLPIAARIVSIAAAAGLG